MNTLVDPSALRFRISKSRTEFPLEYSPDLEAVWGFMEPKGVPCFSLTLMREIRAQDGALEAEPGFILHGDARLPVRYYISASRVPGVFSYGGDLSLFLTLIRARDGGALRAYAGRCLDCLWPRLTGFGAKNLTSISLVQGAAFGGGWEGALASDIIIAEAGARFMFPEIKFNLFPGMGAFSLLARRVGPGLAQRLMWQEERYTAQMLHEMGLVDVVVPDGCGEQETVRWIRNSERRANGLSGIVAARKISMPLTRAELDAIADRWVEAALNLTDMDLRAMNRILLRQQSTGRLVRPSAVERVAEIVANEAVAKEVA